MLIGEPIPLLGGGKRRPTKTKKKKTNHHCHHPCCATAAGCLHGRPPPPPALLLSEPSSGPDVIARPVKRSGLVFITKGIFFQSPHCSGIGCSGSPLPCYNTNPRETRRHCCWYPALLKWMGAATGTATNRLVAFSVLTHNTFGEWLEIFPFQDNLFEWHFTIRGPADSEFEGGIYHGRIVLPPEYPMKPPSIILLTVRYFLFITFRGPQRTRVKMKPVGVIRGDDVPLTATTNRLKTLHFAGKWQV